jgi:hypothetical protein
MEMVVILEGKCYFIIFIFIIIYRSPSTSTLTQQQQDSKSISSSQQQLQLRPSLANYHSDVDIVGRLVAHVHEHSGSVKQLRFVCYYLFI